MTISQAFNSASSGRQVPDGTMARTQRTIKALDVSAAKDSGTITITPLKVVTRKDDKNGNGKKDNK